MAKAINKQLVGWGEARTPTSTKSPIVELHFIQPNLRVVPLKMMRCSAASMGFYISLIMLVAIAKSLVIG